MPPYAVHAVVTGSHRLVIDLPADFPEGEVEVVLRPIAPAASSEAKQVLGQRLRALRQNALDAGMVTLDWNGIRREVQSS
ncbi:MAG: hypothetical protein Q8M20_13835 [Rhodocyclaceae bacterium]|nr:hypothetical protein [Rhodocyclaceae bacterium]MDZ4216080.1 hypothetical protein [Rhodocyclaceae bacterium]